ncbi:MAG: conjugal transfer protein TraG [Rhodocyclaceae bacterium]|nr:MAG: conjugal transfer protein TraG [Rhodocyclaceae bacterium]
MNFTIYTLGDLSTLTAMLNGVAMIFNDPIFNDGGTMGGSLVRLMFMGVLAGVVLAGMLNQWRNGQGSPVVLLTVFVMWMTLGFTRTTVTVQDLYSGAGSNVANVPMIVALPGGVFSDIGQVLGEKMQTGFSKVDAQAPTLTTTGFVNPLSYILALRRNMASGMQPFVYNSLRYFASDCVLGSDQMAADLYTGNDSLQSVLMDPRYRDGFTTMYTVTEPTGFLAGCGALADALIDNLNAWAALPLQRPALNNMLMGGVGNNILQGAAEIGKGVRVSNGTSLSGIDETNVADVLMDTLGRTSAAGVTDAAKISASLAFLPGFADGLQCGTPVPGMSLTDVNTCALMSSDQDELARITEAARGSGFSRALISSMAVFQSIWIGLSPVVMLAIMGYASRGPAIFGSYLLLGVWIASWLPVAYMINYYIDLSFRQGVAQLAGPGGTFKLAQVYSIYRVAADKISVASDLMGSVPVLTFAILSGSMYALTKAAGTAARAEGINPQAAHMPAAAHMQGLVATTSPYSVQGYDMNAVRTGHSQPQFTKAMAAGQVLSSAQESVRSAEDSYNVAKQNVLGDLFRSGRVDGKSAKFGTSVDDAYRSSTESGQQFMKDVAGSGIFHEGEQEKFDTAAKATFGNNTKGAFFYSAGVDTAINNMQGIDAGRKQELSRMMKNSSAFKSVDSSQRSAAGGISEEDMSKVEKGHVLEKGLTKSVAHAHKEVIAARDSKSYAEQISQNADTKQTFDPVQLEKSMRGNRAMGALLDPLTGAVRGHDRNGVADYFFGTTTDGQPHSDKELRQADRFLNKYDAVKGRVMNGNLGNPNEVSWQRAIAMHTALESGLAGKGSMLNAMGGELAGKPASQVDTSKVNAQELDGVAGEVKSAANMSEKDFNAWALQRHGGARNFDYAGIHERVVQVAKKHGIDPEAAYNNSELREKVIAEADTALAAKEADVKREGGRATVDPAKATAVADQAVYRHDKAEKDLDTFAKNFWQAHPGQRILAEGDMAFGTIKSATQVGAAIKQPNSSKKTDKPPAE